MKEESSSDEEWVDAPCADQKEEDQLDDKNTNAKEEERDPEPLMQSEPSDFEYVTTSFGDGVLKYKEGNLLEVDLPFGTVYYTEKTTRIDMDLAKQMKLEANDLFRAKKFHDALGVYSQAFSCVPPEEKEFQSVLLGNRAACFARLEKWDEVIDEASECLALNPEYVKVLARRAEAYEKIKKYQDAVADWKEVIRLDPKHRSARQKLRVLEPLAAAEFEKQKEEVMGQLKNMGDKFLGLFGMKCDDFAFEQDPNTGSYSINIKNGGSKV